MSNNLFVSFTVSREAHAKGSRGERPKKGKPSGPSAEERHAAAVEVIQAHDHWAEIHPGLYYLSSDWEAQDLAGRLRAVLGPSDAVIVIDTNGNTATWHNLPDEVAQYLRAHWNR